jgi:hypothetical protein
MQAAAAKKRGADAKALQQRAASAAERHAALLQQGADANTVRASQQQQQATGVASASPAASAPAHQHAQADATAAQPGSNNKRAAAGRKSCINGSVAALSAADLRPGDLIWAQVICRWADAVE